MIPRLSPNYSWKELLLCFLPSKKNAVSLLEHLMARRSCHTDAIAFRYGRSGLYYLLKALGAKNKKVIMPSYTCVVVANAVICSGNIPVFLDNAPNSFQPSPQSYFDAIDEETVMIIPTHLFGIAEEMEDLYKIVKLIYPQVFVLQDCAHSFFCSDKKGNVVTQWGDGALFGMNISKLINSVKGGILTLKDPVLTQKVRNIFPCDRRSFLNNLMSRIYVLLTLFAFHPLFFKITFLISQKTSWLKSQTQYYDPKKISLPQDFGGGMSNFEATIGLISFSKYDKRIEIRRKIAHTYIQLISRFSSSKTIKLPEYSSGFTWSHFPLIVPPSLRPHLATRLLKMCEPGFIVDYSISSLNAYKNLNYESLPNVDTLVLSIINLPLTLAEGILNSRSLDKKIIKVVNEIQATLESC